MDDFGNSRTDGMSLAELFKNISQGYGSLGLFGFAIEPEGYVTQDDFLAPLQQHV